LLSIRGATALMVAVLSIGAGTALGQGSIGPTETAPAPTNEPIFPVRGAHTYGDGFGAGRGGRRHEGQDVMAACGTKLVAARAGKVQVRSKHPLAGNYIVIDNDANGSDFAYMHLKGPSPRQLGEHVRAGQKIGRVGKTGNATACHLHFEIHTSPGYFEGGHSINPLAKLQKWDAAS
jgi:murein DD-endopeptidase MepM/ murein hydrolase activator NlpD